MVLLSELQSSFYNLAYFQRGDVCRLCWETGATTELKLDGSHEEKLDFNHPDLNLIAEIDTENAGGCTLKAVAARVTYTLGLGIELIENYPRKICQNCVKTVNEFYVFKYTFELSDKRLREILEANYEVKIENYIKNEDFNENSNCSFNEPLLNLKIANELENVEIEVPQKKKKRKKTASVQRTPTYCNICHVDYAAEFPEHNRSAHGVDRDGFRCFGCDKNFRTRKGRREHETEYCKDLKEGFRCQSCPSSLPTRGAYECHMRDHLVGREPVPPASSFPCNSCRKVFKTRANQLQHQALHKKNKNFRNFVCEICGRVFNRHDYLRKHIITHTGDKQYICPHCGFRSAQKSSLTVHIRTHTGERPYSCDICHLKCVSKSNLLAHKRRHAGVKQFECSLCNKKFGYKHSLQEHLESAHERLKTYSCQHCAATYLHQRGLRRHAKFKHGAVTKGDKASQHNTEEQTEKCTDIGEPYQCSDQDQPVQESVQNTDQVCDTSQRDSYYVLVKP